jgi:hypothetical protein
MDMEGLTTPKRRLPKSPTTPAATLGTIGRHSVSTSTVKGVLKIGSKPKSLVPLITEFVKLVLDKKETPSDADIDALLSTVLKELVQIFLGSKLTFRARSLFQRGPFRD